MRFFPIFIGLFFHFSVVSKIYINIGAPEKVKKSLIALSPFVFQSEDSNQGQNITGQEMARRLEKNLKFSGYFNILSPKAFIEDPSKKSPYPHPRVLDGFRWENWKLAGTDFLFFASYSISDRQLTVQSSLHNIHLKKTLFRKEYRGLHSQSSDIVDKISNQIIKSLTGKQSIFETKILSVRTTTGTKKELFVMHWNGEQKKRLTYHKSIVLSPSWSPKGKKVAYSAFVYNRRLKKRLATLFLYDFSKNKIRVLSSRNGANLGSDFFHNRRDMLVTLFSGRGLMDIFRLNLRSLSVRPLTQGPPGVINVEPSVHPKTKKIAFSSDRSGKTMIYVMSASGKNIRQVTFAGNHNSSPDWHPEKNNIVFSGFSKGRMDLFLVSDWGTGLKRLTSLRRRDGRWANCESPSFSPDGRFVVFSSDFSGDYQLYALNLENLSVERITFDRHNYKSPKWSPYI